LFKRCRDEETDELVGQFEQVSYGASKQIITQQRLPPITYTLAARASRLPST
jgi:hypothetical protein